MTWDEFKAKVDAELKARGKDGSIEIDYIDMRGWLGTVDVFVGAFGELEVH